MLTAHDYKQLAEHLVTQHGPVALTYADQAVAEMDAQGETRRAAAWRLLRGIVADLLSGRIESGRPITVH